MWSYCYDLIFRFTHNFGVSSKIVVWEEATWDLVTKMLKIGKFIRLRNAQEGVWHENGMRCLFIQSKTWLTPLPDATYEVFDLLLEHNCRTVHERINPQSGILPIEREKETDSSSSSTIFTLAQALSKPISSRLTVVARIIQTVPKASSGNDIIKLLRNEDGDRNFRFAVKFGDESAELDAVVSNTAGESIFRMAALEACQRQDVAFGFLKRAIDEQSRWRVEIHVVSFRGAKFFVADSVEALC